jgi:hypothetical protein
MADDEAAQLRAADAAIEALWREWDREVQPGGSPQSVLDDFYDRLTRAQAARREIADAYFAARPEAPAPAGEPAHAVRVELARRKATRAAEVLNATFTDFGFGWHDAATAAEVARQARGLTETGDLAADLATIAAAVFATRGFAHDPAAIRAAVARHLAAKP